MLRPVALVRTDVLEECIASITRMERISELRTWQAVRITGILGSVHRPEFQKRRKKTFRIPDDGQHPETE
jgi:hypothetical protein